VNSSEPTLFRAPDLDGVLEVSLWRALSPVPPGGVARLPRPAAVILGARCTDWLAEAAPEPDLVCLVLLRANESPPHDPRIDDVVTALVTRAELAMRARRALARKAVLAPSEAPRADIDGVRWRGRFVALSATEARLAGRLLAEPGAVISEAELATAAFEDGAGTRRALHAHVYRLRLKLRALEGLEIQAVRQRGFRAVLSP
jgi:hypothetical protein